MIDSPPYLMEGERISRFRVVRFVSDMSNLVFLHDGHGTISLTPEDAIALGRGLIAVGSGLTELATTEEALLLEAARRAQRAAIANSPSPHPRPTLENL